MRLRPCSTCRLAGDCDLQSSIVAAIKSTPFPSPGWSMRPTLLSFRCDQRTEGLVPGAVCKTTLIDRWHDYHGERHEPREATCVVMQGYHGRRERFVCYLPPDPEGRNECQVILRYPSQLRPTGETVTLCAGCGRPHNAPVPDTESFFSECGERGQHAGGST